MRNKQTKNQCKNEVIPVNKHNKVDTKVTSSPNKNTQGHSPFHEGNSIGIFATLMTNFAHFYPTCISRDYPKIENQAEGKLSPIKAKALSQHGLRLSKLNGDHEGAIDMLMKVCTVILFLMLKRGIHSNFYILNNRH